MSVLLYAEQEKGSIKKAIAQAATYAHDIAKAGNTEVVAVAFGEGAENIKENLGKYGIPKLITMASPGEGIFDDAAYAGAVEAAAKEVNADIVVFAQTYTGKSIAPRLSIKLDMPFLSMVTGLPDFSDGITVKKPANSGKGIETIRANGDKAVITLKVNSYRPSENPVSCAVETLDYSPESKGAIGIENERASDKISITDADIVVSGGRGMKGPENWGVLEDLAEALGAGTACSKPVSDMDWRPHHEHVGQTGIQIGPNLYIAMGISGAIQHLAGVNTSKNIVVINKDPEAPFFKIADYGIVGDLFEVVPKLTEAVKELKKND